MENTSGKRTEFSPNRLSTHGTVFPESKDGKAHENKNTRGNNQQGIPGFQGVNL